MKKTILFLFCLICLGGQAQVKWYNPMDAGFSVVQNQGWEELSSSYNRLPLRAKETVREQVWNLSQSPTGLGVHFYCNAPQITIRYKVSGPLNMPHVPTTGVSGIDLYSINSDGEWHFCSGNYAFRDTVRYTFNHLGKDRYHNRGFEYRLFLPLRNTVEWLEIGVEEAYELTFIPASQEKPIVLYGTSIVHGACASRPAMAWANIVQRSLDYPLVNLGFAGNGKLEEEVVDLVSEIDARLYILDCLPNLTGQTESEVRQLTMDAVKQLRAKHSEPILLVEHIGYSNAQTDSMKYKDYTKVNKASKEAYQALLNAGYQDIYYLTREELAIPADGWVDNIHPSDYGMHAQATAVEKKVREILKLPVGNSPITRPVTQRREPNNYEWRHRHRSLLEANKTKPPRSVILGNSITHFWGDETHGPRKRGADSWEKVMAAAGFRNLGYGWDRIENVLWRVYHDELDGFAAENVVVMIGTNNIGFNTAEEIKEGVHFLMAAIRQRQPEAQLVVVGLLPRRGHEPLIQNINFLLEEMAGQEGYQFMNPGLRLLQPDGKINEAYFSDGLHPNEEGYRVVVSDISI